MKAKGYADLNIKNLLQLKMIIIVVRFRVPAIL